MHNRRTAIVTGASGAIGRRLCAHLRNAGWRVIGMMHHPANGPWDRQMCCDLGVATADSLAGAFSTERAEVIWHLAGRAHALDEIRGDDVIYRRINVSATETMVQLGELLGVSRFVLASSVKAMGEGSHEIQDEASPCVPTSAYGSSKLAAEAAVLRPELPFVSVALRFCMVYGAGVRGNMPRLVAAARNWWCPMLPENGNRRCYLHVEDAVKACLLAATHPRASGVYIVTDGELYSTAALQNAIRKALGRRSNHWRVPATGLRFAARLGDIGGMVIRQRLPFDSDALKSCLVQQRTRRQS